MKMTELKELTNEELEREIEDLREELFNLRFQNAMNRLENPMRIRETHREIARIKTVQNLRKQQKNS